jgi:uncharacterized membrane protein YbhN (UPF0104 family)
MPLKKLKINNNRPFSIHLLISALFWMFDNIVVVFCLLTVTAYLPTFGASYIFMADMQNHIKKMV